MKKLQRFAMIFGFLIASIIFIHTTKAPQKLAPQGFYVGCLPAHPTENLISDKHLTPYAQIAHTAPDEQKKLWRCYFKFPPNEVVCIPKEVAARQGISSQCPTHAPIDGSPNKTCYLLNKKHQALIDLLQQKPLVNINTYLTKKNIFVRTWQEIRNILLGKEPLSSNVSSLHQP